MTWSRSTLTRIYDALGAAVALLFCAGLGMLVFFGAMAESGGKDPDWTAVLFLFSLAQCVFVVACQARLATLREDERMRKWCGAWLLLQAFVFQRAYSHREIAMDWVIPVVVLVQGALLFLGTRESARTEERARTKLVDLLLTAIAFFLCVPLGMYVSTSIGPFVLRGPESQRTLAGLFGGAFYLVNLAQCVCVTVFEAQLAMGRGDARLRRWCGLWLLLEPFAFVWFVWLAPFVIAAQGALLLRGPLTLLGVVGHREDDHFDEEDDEDQGDGGEELA